jgi:glutamate dehydrogenase/leucine dehydrogenase
VYSEADLKPHTTPLSNTMSNQQAAASFTDKLALGEAKRGENKRRVVVTGGSGKLGRATVKYLSDEGWEVISVDTRRPPTASEDGKSGLGGAYRLVEIDLEDMGAVLETFMTIDMVRVQNMETMKSSCRLT